MKRNEVSIKTRSTPASLSFKGQATKHTTVKWSIFFMITVIAYFADQYLMWKINKPTSNQLDSKQQNSLARMFRVPNSHYVIFSRQFILLFHDHFCAHTVLHLCECSKIDLLPECFSLTTAISGEGRVAVGYHLKQSLMIVSFLATSRLCPYYSMNAS